MTTRSRTVFVCVVCLVFARAAAVSTSGSASGSALSVALLADTASARVGRLATFTASAAGSTEPVEFTFWLFDGAAWKNVRDYGPAPTYSYTPTTAGTAALQVWVRRVGSREPFEAWAGTGLYTVAGPAAPPPARLNALTASTTLPALPGTPITWTAAGDGGVPPLQYQFWRYDSSGWRIVQPYGPSPRYSWTPAAADAGTHALQVWVRSAGSSSALDDWKGTGYFEILSPARVQSVTLVADRSAPFESNQPVTWTAHAGGRSDVEYQFWRFSRSAWIKAREYDADPSYSWTPTLADVGFNAIQVWARAIGSTASLEAWTGTGFFDVMAPAGPQCSALPAPDGACFKPVPSYLSRDYLSGLHVRSAAEAASRRAELIRWIWGVDELPEAPTIPPGALEVDVRHAGIQALHLPNLARVDRYRIDVDVPAAATEAEAPLRSHVYEFVPVSSSGRLLVYNQGHIRDPKLVFNPPTMLGADNVLRLFLERGYTVLFIQMPLLGDNADPRFPVFGEANPHDLLGARERAGYNPLKAFVQPIRVAIEYARSRRTFVDITMLGVSGGGWATTLYAALDPDVINSFPVAGSLPVELNLGADDPCRHGLDWEQAQFPRAPQGAQSGQPLGYLDLYILGSLPAPDGRRRQQVQILNRFDNCCFKGVKAEGTFAEELSAFVGALEGSYSLAIDATHAGHLASECALRTFVLPALAQAGG